MKFGAPFLGSFAVLDPGTIRDYAQAVEALGYDYLAADEVLLNDDPGAIYHESLTLFSYLAAVTTRLRFLTGVMILPKRSTIMVARQAAEVDVLSGGRLTLGVGVGWNKREFQVLGVDFHTRGRRIEEQIRLLNALWTQPTVTFEGEFHSLKQTGINLLPVQRPIPIWMGGGADRVLRRAARIANGWMADHELGGDKLERAINQLKDYLEEHGRHPEEFKIINYLRTEHIPELKWISLLQRWRELGVTHVTVLPRWGGDLKTIDDYLTELSKVRMVIGKHFSTTHSHAKPADNPTSIIH